MSCIVSKAFILLTDAKDRRFSCNCLAYCCQKSTKKDKIDIFFELKWLTYVKDKSFSLFALVAKQTELCDNIIT